MKEYWQEYKLRPELIEAQNGDYNAQRQIKRDLTNYMIRDMKEQLEQEFGDEDYTDYIYNFEIEWVDRYRLRPDNDFIKEMEIFVNNQDVIRENHIKNIKEVKMEKEKLERFEEALKEDIKNINTGDETYTAEDIDYLKIYYITDFIDDYKEIWKIPDNLTESMEDIVEDNIWMLDIYLK